MERFGVRARRAAPERAGRPCRHDDCLLTEYDDADAADIYDSDTDAAAYGGDKL